jgi:hypothetical protein
MWLRSVRAQIDLDNNDNTSTTLVGASALVRESNLDYYVTVFGSCGLNGVGTPCLARLAWAYPRGGVCNMDIDDDGKVLATTDGLILTRIAAGMKGNAVVAGAVGVGARRANWSNIHSYLVNDCGMNIAP